MRSFAAILLVLAGLVTPLPVMASSELAPVAGKAETGTLKLVDDKATELALFLYSRETLAQQLDKTLTQSLPQSMKSASDFGIYEAEYPGLVDAVVAALKPVMLKAYEDKMPLLWATTAQIYRENFGAAELDQLVAFYKSPVGMRYMATARSNVDTQTYMDAAVGAQRELTDEVTAAKNKSEAAAIRKTNQQISAADKLIIFRFENSPLGPKLATTGPLIGKAMMEWDYYFTDEQKRSFLAIRQKTIGEFIGKADAAKQPVNSAQPAPPPANP
jgi:hypothetical protein